MAITLVSTRYAPLKPGKRDLVRIHDALSRNDFVELWGGTFTCTGTLLLASNKLLEAKGPGVTTLTWTDGNFHRVENSDTAGNHHITMRGMTLNFNGSTGSNDVHGIRFGNASDCWFQELELLNSPHHNVVSIDDGDDVNARWHFDDCLSEGAGKRAPSDVQGDGDGFRPRFGFNNPADGPVLTGCRSKNNTHHGFHVGQGGQLIGCYALDNTDANAYLEGDGAKIDGGYFLNTDSTTSQAHNIEANSTPNGFIRGATLSGAYQTGADILRINSCSNFSVEDNLFLNPERGGIHVFQSTKIGIQSNRFVDGGEGGAAIWLRDSDSVSVSDNRVHGWQTGIWVNDTGAGLADISITDNKITGSSTGILIDNNSSVTKIWIDGNAFSGLTESINDTGAHATLGANSSF